MPLTLICVSNRNQTLSVSITLGSKVSVPRGVGITQITYPPTNSSSCHFLLHLSFTLHKSLVCLYHRPGLLLYPSSVSPLTKLQPDKPQDYSSWLLFPAEPIPSFHLILDNGHYTSTILTFTKKKASLGIGDGSYCMHSYIVKDCKHCRLSSRNE